MLASLSRVTAFNIKLLERMIGDIPADQMCQQPPGLPNHPAWTLGHLALVRFGMIKQMGGETSDFPEQWIALFGRGSTPCADVEQYPAKDELWSAVVRLHETTMKCLETLSPEQLERPHSIESLKEPFPTLGDLLVQMLTSHDGLHVGQLSDWRRALGYPRLM